MFPMIKVFGHVSPDTDTVASALLWAWYLNTHTSHKATPYALGQLNKETSFVLRKWGVNEPEILTKLTGDDKVVIVDTNNPEELPTTLKEAKIIEIIDHHKLTGGISTTEPITVTIRPASSTASLMYELMGEANKSLPKEMAGLVLSCIISDTLAFRSPTTTPHDKELAERLASELGVNIKDYSEEMFKAKSDLSDLTDVGLVHLDSKMFEVGGKKLRVSVIETMDASSVLSRKDGIVKAIKEELVKEKEIDDILLFIVSILNEEATVLTYNQFTKDLVEASFGVRVSGDTEVLPGIISRKKHIFPALKLPNS